MIYHITHSPSSVAELHAATNGFDESMRIGQGAFGTVYRGMLHHTPVAVRVLTDPSAQVRFVMSLGTATGHSDTLFLFFILPACRII